MSSIRDLKDFLDHSHSPYHAVANLAARLDARRKADAAKVLQKDAALQAELNG